MRSPGGRPAVRPAPSLSGRVLAALLAGLFVALVLVAAVKGFGAMGHPLLGLIIGLACVASSALIYFLQSRNKKKQQGG